MLEYKPPRVPETLKFGVKMYAELERKVCLQCKEEKSLDLFRRRPKRSSKAFESYCKACEKSNNQKWYRENKQAMKSRDFGRNCAKFGLTVAQYQEMVGIQNSKCAICKRPEESKRSGIVKNLAVDHCHKTGKIRLLLCHSCNTAIGLLKEDPKTIRSAAEYLEKFKK